MGISSDTSVTHNVYFTGAGEMADGFTRLRSLVEMGGPSPVVSAVMYGLNNARKGVTMAEYKPVLRIQNYAGVDRRSIKRPH